METTFKIDPYKVYIQTDSNNYIVAINSSAFISDTTDWIEIDEGMGDKYHHAQGNYLDMPIMGMDGTHNYKYINGKVVERTEEEKAEEKATFPQPPKSDAERIAELEEANETLSEVLDALLMGDIEL